jgi:secreted trypsin-like serine protease
MSRTNVYPAKRIFALMLIMLLTLLYAVPARAQTRIVGGTEATPGAWPWQARITYFGSAWCGGSLFDRQWVVTAAHCVSGRSLTAFQIILGDHDATRSEGTEQTFTAAEIQVHPSYNSGTQDSDVALIRLSSAATLNTRVALVTLAQAPGDNALMNAGTDAITTGWGATSEGGSGSNVLRQVTVPIVSNTTCNSSVAYNGLITANMLCAGRQAGGVDSCQGDSGGPLVVRAPDGIWRLVGIVSWGYGCAEPNKYGVYTRVVNFTNWIRRPSAPPAGSRIWLRADAGVISSSGKVSSWQDQSGNGNHATMSLSSRQPSIVTGALNSLPVIRFSGAQSLGLTSVFSSQSFTIFIVGKNSNPSESFSMILGPGGSSANNQLRWENGTQSLIVGTGNNLPATTSTVANTRIYHALSVRYNASTLTVYRDGNLVSTNSFTTSGAWTFAQLGAWYSSYFLTGDLAEVLVYPTALSETDRGTANGYLRTKYALP